MLQKALDGASIYQKEIPLAPGLYRLNMVCKDITGGNMTTYPMALNVPHFDDEKLASSSLILADLIEKVPTRSIGTGQFVIGDTKVRPRLTDTFDRDEKLGIYTQFYNFSPDREDQQAQWVHRIRHHQERREGFGLALHRSRDRHSRGVLAAGDGGEAPTPAIPEPGQYTLKMKVTDNNSNQVLTPSANFTVK